MKTCATCDNWDVNGQCSQDQHQHPPEHTCGDWTKVLRRDPKTGKPFVIQEIVDPPGWERIAKAGNEGKG